MKQFISCDWGTSSFRLRLVEIATKKILAEIKTVQGIAATYALWKENKNTDRLTFYSYILLENINLLKQQCGYVLDNITIIISGMASSTIGMMELPYKDIPFKTDGTDLLMHVMEASAQNKHSLIIVSGVRSSDDVMRGEETMLAGCDVLNTREEQLFIFPGTHSKHIMVQNGLVQHFKTYITGELFDLLTTKSILTVSVENTGTAEGYNASFTKGVKEAIASNLLNSAFHVRTNQLFGLQNKEENYHYLSGLLIGAELKDLINKNYSSITLVSSGALAALYEHALLALGFKEKLRVKNADEALINGQSLIAGYY